MVRKISENETKAFFNKQKATMKEFCEFKTSNYQVSLKRVDSECVSFGVLDFSHSQTGHWGLGAGRLAAGNHGNLGAKNLVAK